MSNQKHNHYFKNVEHLKTIDVYRVIQLFGITDPCLQHALKKLLVAGGRGAGKGPMQDIQEVIDSCNRYMEMVKEDVDAQVNALRSGNVTISAANLATTSITADKLHVGSLQSMGNQLGHLSVRSSTYNGPERRKFTRGFFPKISDHLQATPKSDNTAERVARIDTDKE